MNLTEEDIFVLIDEIRQNLPNKGFVKQFPSQDDVVRRVCEILSTFECEEIFDI